MIDYQQNKGRAFDETHKARADWPIFIFCCLVLLASCAQLKEMQLDKAKKPFEVFNVQWIQNLEAVHNTGNLSIGLGSPLIDDDRLFVGDLSGVMRALDVTTGRVLWSHTESGAIQSAPLKLDDYLFYGTQNGRLYARHFATGNLLFATDLNSPIESTPVSFKGRLFLHMRDHSLIALDAKTGKVFWRYQRSVPYLTTLQRVSPILPTDSGIFLGTADGYVVKLDMLEGLVLWEQKISQTRRFVDVEMKPYLLNNLIVAAAVGSPMSFLSKDNGTLLKVIPVLQATTPLEFENNLVIGTQDGKIVIFNGDGEIIKEQLVDKQASISSIKFWKNHWIVTTTGPQIYALDSKSLEIVDSFHLGSTYSAIFGEVSMSENYFAVLSARNRLYLFQ